MSTREEVNEAITAFAIAVKESMAAHYLIDSDEQDLIKARQNKRAARARLLALLAPEPEPSDAEIKYVAETLYRDDFGYDASLIAAGDSDQLRYRHMARIALEAAARAARQTGRASE